MFDQWIEYTFRGGMVTLRRQRENDYWNTVISNRYVYNREELNAAVKSYLKQILRDTSQATD